MGAKLLLRCTFTFPNDTDGYYLIIYNLIMNNCIIPE